MCPRRSGWCSPIPRPARADVGTAATERGECHVRDVGAHTVETEPGRFLVRMSFTPYWSIARGQGCLVRHGDWTVARVARPGVFRVAADFSLGRAWNAVTGAKKTC